MKNRDVLIKLREKDILSEQEYQTLDNYERTRPISIHWEIRVLLIAGISMLTGGLGVLIYKNIDTIGHQAIIGLIALAIIGCGWYVFKKRRPFALEIPQKEQPLADNMLLLGCSLFLILEGYLQYQYNIFGTRYGLAMLIPTLLFFFSAYRFDHIGVLTMAMTAFASWAGITATPLSIFKEDVFKHQPTLIHTGIAVGIFLIVIGLFLNYRRIKPHFTFSYLNFGYNLLSIALIYGAFQIDKALYSLICLIFAALAIGYARREQSFFFLLAGVIYGYIAFTVLLTLIHLSFEGWLFYGVLSCLAVVLFFINYKKFIYLK